LDTATGPSGDFSDIFDLVHYPDILKPAFFELSIFFLPEGINQLCAISIDH